MSTGTLSDSGETATGNAQSSIALTHQFDDSGNLTELALALASSAATTYDGTVGSAEARGAPNLQWEFYVTRDVQFDWDLTLMGVGEGGCNAAYELRATLTGSELIHSTLLADELGTLPTMGSTLFEAGEFYRITVATGSQPRSSGDLDFPAGTCTIDGAFTFSYP